MLKNRNSVKFKVWTHPNHIHSEGEFLILHALDMTAAFFRVAPRILGAHYNYNIRQQPETVDRQDKERKKERK